MSWQRAVCVQKEEKWLLGRGRRSPNQWKHTCAIKNKTICHSNILATWCEELTHLKRPWCWGRLKAGGEGDNRGWDGWMASLTQWTWVWVNSRSWWWTGRPGVLQSMGSQSVGHDWATELKWTKSIIQKLTSCSSPWCPKTDYLFFFTLLRLKASVVHHLAYEFLPFFRYFLHFKNLQDSFLLQGIIAAYHPIEKENSKGT